MNKRWLGIGLVIMGSIFWGASGTVTNLMLRNNHTDPIWIVTIAFITSGIMLLTYHGISSRQPVFAIWQNKPNRKRLIAFGILGMMPTQLLYFIAIRFSNAATATILQFTGPVFIIIYLALKNHRLPTKIDFTSVVIAVIGTVLLVTRGNLLSLSISGLGILFGLGAGLASAIYTLLPEKLLTNYDGALVCGWGFLLGSLPLIPFIFINSHATASPSFIFELLFVIIAGTMFAYLFYVESIIYLHPTISGILASFEPLTATVLSVLFLNLRLNGAEILGTSLILLMAIIQAIPQKD